MRTCVASGKEMNYSIDNLLPRAVCSCPSDACLGADAVGIDGPQVPSQSGACDLLGLGG